MFDVGFTELMLIGIVGLVVIGPERLPGVARTAGKYFGKLRRFMTNVKADVESELRADELREILKKQQDELQSLKKVVDEVGKDVDTGVSKMEAEIDQAAEAYQKQSAEEGSSWTDTIAAPGLNDNESDSELKPEPVENSAEAVAPAKKAKKVAAKAKPKAKPKAKASAKAKPKVKSTAKSKPKSKPKTTKAVSE